MKKLGFGLMRLPVINDDSKAIDISTVKKMVDKFMENGFTYFDTAAPYHNGMSENAFREAVSERYPRDSYTITDKLSLFMINSADEIPAFFDRQLQKLGVDYLDYYLLHSLNRNTFEKAESFKAFEFAFRKKSEGKIKHVGFSFHDSPEVLDRILTAHPEVEYVQLQINYLDWEDKNIQSRRCYETAVKHGKPVIVMEPVKGGALVNIPKAASELLKSTNPDISVASWAIRFAASLDNVFMVLSGMSNEAQIDDNLSYMKDFSPLSESEKQTVTEAADIIRNSIAIPCTSCRYCVDGCPKKIAIPDYFRVYNEFRRFEGSRLGNAKNDYKNIAKNNGKASDCIKCGLCEKSCPQNISIRKYLEEIADKFE